MNLKLSYRDKVIFITVMVILVLVAGFFLFIRPKFASVEQAKLVLEQKQQEKIDIDTKIGTLPDIIDNLKATAKEIGEKQEIFMVEDQPYVNENYIREILSEMRAEVNSMTTTYTSASSIDWYAVNPENILAYDNKINADLYNELPQEVYDAYNHVAPPQRPGSIVGVTNMVISFNSDARMNKLYDVMDRLAEDEKTIVLNTVNATAPEDGAAGEVPVIMNLTMYSIFPLNVDKVMEETTEIKPIEQPADAAAETTAE